MKTKLVYPKISNSSKALYEQCMVFEKYDGSNIHWKYGGGTLDAFGTRRHSYRWTSEGIADFIQEHKNLKDIEEVYSRQEDGLKCIIGSGYIFTEFFGENSFAGEHEELESHQLRVIDVSDEQLEIVSPVEFVEMVPDVCMARMVYDGKLNGPFIQSVRDNRMGVFEGVVCKGVKSRWMAKIKTNAYKQKLIDVFGDRWVSYWE